MANNKTPNSLKFEYVVNKGGKFHLFPFEKHNLYRKYIRRSIKYITKILNMLTVLSKTILNTELVHSFPTN